ncbi:MAG: Ig-like domain-containing protein [Saccharospirillum sp.]|nr:Ig-like domain-containing protein [Saccharospirillum sp.]
MSAQSPLFWATLLCVSSLTLSGCNSSSDGGAASNDPPTGNGNGNGDGNGGGSGDGNNDGDGGGDSGTLSVVRTYPTDGATLVPLNAIIRAELNNDINESFQDELIKLYQGALEVSGQGRSTDLPYNEIRFTPASPLEKDTEYSVTLFADLEDNEFNELGVNYNWTFRTLAKDWTTESSLTADLEAAYLSRGENNSRTGDRYDGPEIAMNVQGDAVVAWSSVLSLDSGVIETDLVVRLFDSSTGQWSSPEVLGRHEFRDSGDGGAYRPGIAINAGGDILVAYPSNNETGQSMIVYQWDGVDWSDTIIATDSIESTFDANGYYRSARVALDDSGSAAVVWGQRLDTLDSLDDSTSPFIWASHFDEASGEWDDDPTGLSLAMRHGGTPGSSTGQSALYFRLLE